MGGMAELFLAQEPPRPGLLVIKRILPYLSEEPEFVQMFLDEARIAAQLHHPNIVQVFELGRINESIFIAMEYLEGVDLRRLLAEEAKFSSAVPYAVAARICAQVASGLDHAHHAKGVGDKVLGLIHRDVSPQNVMVTYNGDVKLVDFGIAKAEAIAERSKPGVIKGKFLYLSPEQVMQEKLDHRLDIFALGVMLYEVTTGRAPFARPTTEGILYAIRSESPSPPHLIRDDYPTELSRIVMKCLVKDRNQRYQRASQVAAELEDFLASGVLKQSADVAAYAARLLGGEEERTVLHVPIPRKDSSGLTSRPVRRQSAQNLPPAVDAEGEEPATQMARPPRGRPEPPVEEEEVDSEPTAMRTMPGRLMARPPAGAPPRPPPRTVSGESTMDDRPQRNAAAARSAPGARKSPSTSLTSLDRRRGPPVPEEPEEEEEYEDEADDENEEGLSGTAPSITASTLNDRKPLRPPTSLRPSIPVASDENTSSQSGTESMPPRLSASFSARRGAQAAPLALEEDSHPHPDEGDDESTAGYDTSADADHTPGPAPRSTRAAPRQSRGLMIALGVLLLLLLGVLAWFFLFARGAEGEGAPVAETSPRPRPEKLPPTPAPVSPKPTPPQVPPTQASTAGTDAPPPSVGPSSGTSTGVGTQVAGGAVPPTPSPAGPAVPAPVKPPVQGPVPPSPTKEPAPPARLRVQFQAPAHTVLKVNGQRVTPNTFLELEPGSLQVFVHCPGLGAPQWTRNYTVSDNPTKEVTIPLDCRQRGRR